VRQGFRGRCGAWRAGKKGGKLTRDEVMGLVRPHFDHLHTNGDGFLDLEELKAVAAWLNRHHQPGRPPRDRK
jgi:hypothetical protein